MAVESIELYPTCYIHLLLQGPGGAPTPYQLEVRDYREGINLSGDVLKGSGSVDDHRNLLFLADGFTAAQKPLFKTIVTLIKDSLFTSRVHSPYDVLKDRFNVWLAFEPSSEEGASAGDWVVKTGTGPFGTFTGRPITYRNARPTNAENYTLEQLILKVGLPDRYHPIPSTRLQARQAFLSLPAGGGYIAAKLEDDVLDTWVLLRDYHLLQAKDSFFGLMNGYRRGDRYSQQIDPNAAAGSLMHWYLADEPPHGLTKDRRRLSREWNPYEFRDAYLRSLRVAATNADISQVWVNGKDRSLVVILVNSAFDGGQRSEGGVNVSARGNTSYSELHIAGREADHGVPEILVLPSFPALVGSSVEEIASVLAHELAHSFALGDEYEGYDYGGVHDVLQESDTDARTSIAQDNNLVHHYSIANPAGGRGRIDMDRVKWRLWHRIAQASVLTEDPDVLTGNRLGVHVPPAERGKWESARADGADVFLRSRNINADLLEQPSDDDSNGEDRWFLEGPLKVQDVQADGTVILTGSSFDVFEEGDVLYRARVENGSPLTVFHPDVLLDLEVFGGPFATKEDPTKPEEGAAYPPERLATTAPNLKPRHPAFVVGVYEGGGTYTSRVYRSSGTCKMRYTSRSRMREKPLTFDPLGTPVVGPEREVTQYVPFCYVCRYTIVNAVDPTFLDQLVYPD